LSQGTSTRITTSGSGLPPTQTKGILLKIVIIGESSAGKTALMTRFVDEKFTNDYLATVGIDFKFKNIKVPIVSK
jgi:GTPase SAR1 family protein